MITKEQIEQKITQLKHEQNMLQLQHDKMVRERNEREQQFSQIVTSNQARFQQITGALIHLNELINQPNGEKPA